MADGGNQVDQTTVDRLPSDDDHPATDGHAVRVLDKALLGGEPQRVGKFEYRYDDGAGRGRTPSQGCTAMSPVNSNRPQNSS
jgi:hypothetical protein